jgi:hypothetical protein
MAMMDLYNRIGWPTPIDRNAVIRRLRELYALLNCGNPECVATMMNVLWPDEEFINWTGAAHGDRPGDPMVCTTKPSKECLINFGFISICYNQEVYCVDCLTHGSPADGPIWPLRSTADRIAVQGAR